MSDLASFTIEKLGISAGEAKRRALSVAEQVKESIPDLRIDNSRDYGFTLGVCNPETMRAYLILSHVGDEGGSTMLLCEDVPGLIRELSVPAVGSHP